MPTNRMNLLGKVLRLDVDATADAYAIPDGEKPLRRGDRRPAGDLGLWPAQPVALLI